MHLLEGPLRVIGDEDEDRMLQSLLVHIHGLEEVLLLQIWDSIQGFILQVITSSYVHTHKLTGFWGYPLGL